MKDGTRTWSSDVRVGEQVSIGDGAIRLRVDSKSGQQARITLEFVTPTTVEKVASNAVKFARRGVE